MITQPKERTVVVTRPVMMNGERKECGVTMTLPLDMASSLVSANKAQWVAAGATPAAPDPQKRAEPAADKATPATKEPSKGTAP